jgi:hypothetical protein
MQSSHCREDLLLGPYVNVHSCIPGLSNSAAVTVAHKAASVNDGPWFLCAWHLTAAFGAENGRKEALVGAVLAVLQVLLLASMATAEQRIA